MNKKPAPQHLKAWRLFLTANARITSQIDQNLRASDLIPLNWYDVLIELYEAPDQRLRMSDLAERVLLTRSGLTRLVDRLEAQGYLTRKMDPEDRRGFYATITEPGIDALRSAWQVYADGIQNLFAQYLSDDEAQRLVEVLTKMLANPMLKTE